MSDGQEAGSNCCSSHKKSCCPIFRCLYAVLHIAILTCSSMAMWKTAWAVDALVDATSHSH